MNEPGVTSTAGATTEAPGAMAEAPPETTLEVAGPRATAPRPEESPHLRTSAVKAALATLVALGIIVAALALWKLRLIVALLFLAMVIASAIRPSVEVLRRYRVPRAVGVLLHYAAIGLVTGLLVWLIVPRALTQVEGALGVSGLPSAGELGKAAKTSTGVKHEILVALQSKLREVRTTSDVVRPGVEVGRTAFEVLVGIFFVFASAAYWIFERDRAVELVTSLLPRPRRKVVRDTWRLIDLKLGAYVRGVVLLIVLVAVVLSLAFWAIGLPYWILVGTFAGIVEIVPVVGPLVAATLAIGAGLTQSVTLAVMAGVVVLVVRLAEDYLVMPYVLGDAVGLTPLIVLVSVAAVGILFGGFAVILAIPLAATLATLVSVTLLDVDPAEEEVPSVLLNPAETEPAQ